MKFTVECSSFKKVLGNLEKVASRKNTTPILANIYVKATKEDLVLRATDLELEMTITQTEGVTVEKEGVTTVPVLLLNNIVQKLPSGSEIKIELDEANSRLLLKAGRSNYRLPTLTADDFPHMGTSNLPISFNLETKHLNHLFSQTSFAVSTEETRYYLTGVYFHIDERNDTKVLKAAATDGHRLATCEVPLPEGADNMSGIIVPKKTVEEMRKLIGDVKEVSIQTSEQRISCTVGNVSLISKTIDGKFPNYKDVIPAGDKNNKHLRISVNQFKDALDRIATLSDASTRSVKLSLTKENLNLAVSLSETEGEERVDVVSYDGQELEIGFNSIYLSGILGLIGSDTVLLSFSDSASPVIITDEADEETLFVLMPMRV